MQVHQVIIRPQGDVVVILFIDEGGNRDTLMFDASAEPSVAALVAACEQRLPSPANHPRKEEIQKEIRELQNRITGLKESIGQT